MNLSVFLSSFACILSFILFSLSPTFLFIPCSFLLSLSFIHCSFLTHNLSFINLSIILVFLLSSYPFLSSISLSIPRFYPSLLIQYLSPSFLHSLSSHPSFTSSVNSLSSSLTSVCCSLLCTFSNCLLSLSASPPLLFPSLHPVHFLIILPPPALHTPFFSPVANELTTLLCCGSVILAISRSLNLVPFIIRRVFITVQTVVSGYQTVSFLLLSSYFYYFSHFSYCSTSPPFIPQPTSVSSPLLHHSFNSPFTLPVPISIISFINSYTSVDLP